MPITSSDRRESIAMVDRQPQSPDPKALKILFDTYWSSKGWKEEPKTPPDDLAYAMKAGVMFPPQDYEHDAAIHDVIRLRGKIAPKAVADQFLASLSTRRLDLRSALGSYAVGRHLPEHQFVPSEVITASGDTCGICGESNKVQKQEDVSVLNFERHKWGGIRHLHTDYIAFDLARFQETALLKPTDEDRGILRSILDVARNADPKLSPGKLEKAIPGLLPGSKQEYSTLLEILGYAGVLQPKEYPSFLDSYVTCDELRESHNDTNYPFCWWRGSDGVNEAAVKFWWPKL
jgi:hypothetical protein